MFALLSAVVDIKGSSSQRERRERRRRRRKGGSGGGGERERLIQLSLFKEMCSF